MNLLNGHFYHQNNPTLIMKINCNVVVIQVVVFIHSIKCWEPFSIGSAIALVGSVVYNKVIDNTYCKMTECCTRNEIPADFDSKFFFYSIFVIFISVLFRSLECEKCFLFVY